MVAYETMKGLRRIYESLEYSFSRKERLSTMDNWVPFVP